MPQAKANSPTSSGTQLHRRLTERGQRAADSEVGEDDTGGAVAALLPVEPQPERHA